MTTLHCHGCNKPGEAPRIVYDKQREQPTVLRPRFGWFPDRPAMLCADCEKKLDQRKRRRVRA